MGRVRSVLAQQLPINAVRQLVILLSHTEQLFAKSPRRGLFAHRAEPGGLFPVMR